MDNRVWRYPTATAQAYLDNDISIITISGVVTPSVASRILADNAEWLASSGALAQVASYQGSVIAITPDALLSSALEFVDHGLSAPTALLVTPDQHGVVDHYCSLMAMQGICRAPALNWDRALSWAQRQARVTLQRRDEFRSSAWGRGPTSHQGS